MKCCSNLSDFSRFQIMGFICTTLFVRRNVGAAVLKVNSFWKGHKILRNLKHPEIQHKSSWGLLQIPKKFEKKTLLVLILLGNVKIKRDFFSNFFGIRRKPQPDLCWIPECFRLSNFFLYSRKAFLPRSVVTGSRKWHDICLYNMSKLS